MASLRGGGLAVVCGGALGRRAVADGADGEPGEAPAMPSAPLATTSTAQAANASGSTSPGAGVRNAVVASWPRRRSATRATRGTMKCST
jgi:hypothetical protein